MREEYFDYIDNLKNKSNEQKLLEENYYYYKYKQTQTKRIASLITIVVGIIIYIMFKFLFKSESLIPSIVGLILTTSGIAYFLINYLQTDNISAGSSRNDSYRTQLALEDLRLELQKLKRKSGITNDNKDINQTINNIINNTFTEEYIQTKIEKTFGNNAIKNEQFNNLFREFDKTSQRINEELLRLRKSANINLVIGSLFTTLVIIALTYEVFFSEINFDVMVSLLSHYIPRISLVIFVEIFAFFFLKLYKSNLNEIKYFNNEKTNIDFKLTTLKTALFQEDLEMIKICLTELIKTERNFILKKDESTVEIEKNKYENSNSKAWAEIITKIIPSKH